MRWETRASTCRPTLNFFTRAFLIPQREEDAFHYLSRQDPAQAVANGLITLAA